MSIVMKQYNNLATLEPEQLLRGILESDTIVEDIFREQLRSSRGKSGLLPQYKYPQFKDLANYRGRWPHFDLYDTGDFQRGIVKRYEGSTVIFSSTDSKASIVIDRIGSSEFDLDVESLKKVQEKITPLFNKAMHEELNR